MSNVNAVMVVMGVSGSGKSTVAELVSQATGAQYIDADDLHPQVNIDKMASGIALTDEDRWPWLRLVAQTMNESTSPLVVACSALRRDYRNVLRNIDAPVFFVHLHGSRDLLAQRLGQRGSHFMPTTLLDSQLETLEQLEPDELFSFGAIIDISQPLNRNVTKIVELWNEHKN